VVPDTTTHQGETAATAHHGAGRSTAGLDDACARAPEGHGHQAAARRSLQGHATVDAEAADHEAGPGDDPPRPLLIRYACLGSRLAFPGLRRVGWLILCDGRRQTHTFEPAQLVFVPGP
jgi:hypothetical protein